MGNPSQDLRALAADNINPQDERMPFVIEDYKESRLQNIQEQKLTLNELIKEGHVEAKSRLELLNQEEKLLNELSAEHYIELSREPRFFGALLHIEALSKALQLNIVVKNTSNQTENIFSSQIGRPFIAILYNGRNHYDYESHRSA